MQSELERLRFENAVLKEKSWARKSTKKYTRYFFLVDTKFKPENEFDRQRAIDQCDQMMAEFSQSLQSIVQLNRKTHSWSPEYIDDVKIKYVVEIGLGRLKKDGTRGKSGGTVHIHVYLTIYHFTNLTVTQEALVDFFAPKVLLEFGTRVFVGRPRLIPLNRIEEYMEKSLERAVWRTIQVPL